MAKRPGSHRSTGWSLSLGSWFGVPVRVHWTFFLLMLALALWVGYERGWQAASVWAVTVVLLFLSVLLHELGHSLTAVGLGYGVRDITLLPIGGVSRMESSTRDPLDELMITAAGPVVNFVIALGLGGILVTDWAAFHPIDMTRPWYVSNLLWLNLMLGIFNLLPAFPMDGGRLLRSLLSLMMGRVAATRAAVLLGQGLALLMIVGGLFVNLWLVLIGGFVFLAGRAESRSVIMEERLRGVKAGAVAVRDPQVLGPSTSVGEVRRLARSSFQRDFPLVDETGRLRGLLGREALGEALQGAEQEAAVERWGREAVEASTDESLAEVYRRMAERGASASVVTDAEGRPVGLVTIEQLRDVLQGETSSTRSDRESDEEIEPGGKRTWNEDGSVSEERHDQEEKQQEDQPQEVR